VLLLYLPVLLLWLLHLPPTTVVVTRACPLCLSMVTKHLLLPLLLLLLLLLPLLLLWLHVFMNCIWRGYPQTHSSACRRSKQPPRGPSCTVGNSNVPRPLCYQCCRCDVPHA
jgi:hypothetical protein